MRTVRLSGFPDKREDHLLPLGGWPRVAVFLALVLVAVVALIVTRDAGTVALVVGPLMLPAALVLGVSGTSGSSQSS